MKSLLMFHLGPVQPFIAQARKTSDLWMGSYLLSWLMRKSLEEVYGEDSKELLFPSLKQTQPAGASRAAANTPNKFVAVHASSDQAHKAAEAMQGAITARWNGLVSDTRTWVEKHVPDLLTGEGEAIWKRQTESNNLFEIAWVIVPIEGSYGDAYKQAIEALDGRKLLHDFKPQDEGGEKSTISGEREALPCTIPDRDSSGKSKRLPEKVTSPLHMSEGERLDAVDVVRRRAPYIPALFTQEGAAQANLEPPFPSADTVATRSFVAALLKRLNEVMTNGKPEEKQWFDTLITKTKEWDDWLTAHPSAQSPQVGLFYRPDTTPGLTALRDWLTDGQVGNVASQLLSRDGEAVFKGSFSRKRLAFQLGKTEQEVEEDSKKVRSLLSGMMAAAGKLGVPALSPYYAVIKLDGDRMGDTISKLPNPEAHTAFSQALSTFAHKLQGWVREEDYLGRVVYAGGDDALILAPADRALALAHKLQASYVAVARPPLEELFQAGKIKPPTASVGIVIAHRLAPLRIVLNEARKAEEAAKHSYHRNALVVTTLWRGGRSVSVGAKWSAKGAIGDIVDLTSSFVGYFRDNTLSDKFAYSLEEEAPALVNVPSGGQESEIQRLLKRRHGEGKGDVDEQLLAHEVAELAQTMEPKDGAGNPLPAPLSLAEPGPRRGLVEVSGWLRLASFLARGRDAGEDE